MTNSEFLRVFENTLELDPNSIAGHEALTDLAWWDSLAVLSFMAVADQQLQITISVEQITKCQTVADLLRLLAGKTAS